MKKIENLYRWSTVFHCVQSLFSLVIDGVSEIDVYSELILGLRLTTPREFAAIIHVCICIYNIIVYRVIKLLSVAWKLT